jgi:glutamyl-tRNA synthetase
MDRKVRVRFAPSPTGPLHMGGVRTALYNYLFAKKHKGDFILRVEDTDQTRFVPGAEEYIVEALKWCGIEPNEGIGFGDGPHAPYRQSERKAMYKQYALQLIESGHAYYAFDTSEEIETMRTKYDAPYNYVTREAMKNSLTLPKEDVEQRLANGEAYVIRIKIPRKEEVRVNDLIRGTVLFHSNQLDDKVLFKSDGMPTYHLANVVDDYLMQVSHVIRGEEWLPSAPLHVLLYDYLGWKEVMPAFAHLPLLLKPDGNGKLSKRDGDRLGFPVFPLEWKAQDSEEVSSGYREKGYEADAFINMLALLGWNPGNNQELFEMDELIQLFTIERISKSGAKFDPAKAIWFNQQYVRKKSPSELAKNLIPRLKAKGFAHEEVYVTEVCRLIQEKVSFENEILSLSTYFFSPDFELDKEVLSKKWNPEYLGFFNTLAQAFQSLTDFNAINLEDSYKKVCEDAGLKPGQVMQILRILVSGQAGGPAIFEMMALIGKEQIVSRIQDNLKKI